MDADLVIRFQGPFSWPGAPDAPSVFDADAAKAPGIYLWTVPLAEGHLVYYVGETGRTFRIHMLEHYMEHAAGLYHLNSPIEFAQGRRSPTWPGRYDATDRRSIPECIAQYSALTGPIIELTGIYRFFLAHTTCEDRLRRRVEAAIASTLYAAPGPAGAFQEAGIRYDRRLEQEEPLACAVSSSAHLIGLPSELSV